jgi:hypothetical protein
MWVYGHQQSISGSMESHSLCCLLGLEERALLILRAVVVGAGLLSSTSTRVQAGTLCDVPRATKGQLL